MKRIEKISKNIKDTGVIASVFLKEILLHTSTKTATLVTLSGELGAGKTTFTQFIAEELGIKNKINSPTFVIIKRYPLNSLGKASRVFDDFFHIDAYRLKNEKEILSLGWKDIVSNPKNLIILEWPENVQKIMPKKYHQIKISHLKEEHRKFELKML